VKNERWPQPAQIAALATYGVRQVVLSFSMNWDGGTSTRCQVIGSFFQEDEGKVFAKLGQASFNSLLDAVQTQATEILAEKIEQSFDGNYEGGIAVDVPSGTFAMTYEEL